ncbi:MAG: HDIG domain-containing metalloprotein [Kofleriaceae bacterium]
MPTDSQSPEIPPAPGTGPVPQRSLASLQRNPRGELAKAIPRRPRVSLGLGLALAFVFALVALPTITSDRLLASAGIAKVEAGKPAPLTIRVPSLAGFETVEKRFGNGGIVIARGHVASAQDVENVQAVVGAGPTGALPYAALFLVPFVLAAIFTHHMRRSTRGRLVRVQLVSLATIIVIAIAVKIAMLFTAVSALVVPVALIVFVATIALDRIVGLASGVLLALVVGLLGPFDVGVAIVLLVQAAVAGLVVAEQPKDRLRAVLVAGGITTVCTAGTFVLLSYLTTGAPPRFGDPLHSPWFAALLGPVIASVLAVPLVPVYQVLVGEITRAKLVELDDHAHPLLKQIAEKAPGTWQHSLAMANMAQTAANAIGADPRLVRIGALYHDLGKSLAPSYFIENLDPGETSPHDKLPPEVSTDAIFAHVTEGIVAARKAGLHERIVDFMHMHHGNGVLEYFWGKAQEQGNPNNFTVENFRYPGHPPQSRETAILAICDAVEAASRTLKKPDSKAIDALVQRIVYGKLHLGQLDESGLSMADLRILSNSLKETIRHANHGRIEYPWQKAQQDASASDAPQTGTHPRLDSLDRAPDKHSPVSTPKPQLEIVDSREITLPRKDKQPEDSDALAITAPIPASERAKSVSSPPAVAVSRGASAASSGLAANPPASRATLLGHEGAPLGERAALSAEGDVRDSEPEVEISREPSKPMAVARDTSQPNVIAREASGPFSAVRTKSGEQAAVRRTGEQPLVGRTKSGEQATVRRTDEQPVTRSPSGPHVVARAPSDRRPASGEQPIVRSPSGEQPVVARTPSGEIDPVTGRTRSSELAPVPSGLARPGRAASKSDADPRRTEPIGIATASKPTSQPPETRVPESDNLYPPAELRAFTPIDPRNARGPTTMERRAASASVDASEWSDRSGNKANDWSDTAGKIDPAALTTQKGHAGAPHEQSWTERGAQNAPWPELAGEASQPVDVSNEAPGMTTLRGQGKGRTPVGGAHDTIPPTSVTIEPRKRAATLPPVPSRRAPTVPPTTIPPSPRTSPAIPQTTPLDARKSGPPLPVDLENATTNPPPLRYNTTLAPQAPPRPPAKRAELFQHDPAHVHTDATATGMPQASDRDAEERITLPPLDENLRTTIPPDLAGRTTPMPAMDEANLSVGDDTSPSLDLDSIDTFDIHPSALGQRPGSSDPEREEERTNPAMPRFVDEHDRGLPLRAPPTNPPHTRPSKPPPNAKSALAARVDAAMASDEWSPETPVKAPTSAELRSLLGVPDPTRQQSIEEIERLHQAGRDVVTPEPEILGRRRSHHTTNEVREDDIEAAIEIVPPARRSSTIGVAKPKKPSE